MYHIIIVYLLSSDWRFKKCVLIRYGNYSTTHWLNKTLLAQTMTGSEIQRNKYIGLRHYHVCLFEGVFKQTDESLLVGIKYKINEKMHGIPSD